MRIAIAILLGSLVTSVAEPRPNILGYTTGIFGKWHNGSQPPYPPNSRGFDEFYGFTSGHHARYFDPELAHNDRIHAMPMRQR